jgi:hypothetical protein
MSGPFEKEWLGLHPKGAECYPAPDEDSRLLKAALPGPIFRADQVCIRVVICYDFEPRVF